MSEASTMAVQGGVGVAPGVQITPVPRTRRGIRRFLRVPYGIYRDDPHWVAPLLMDLRKVFTDANPLFEHALMQLWVAERGGRDVGRIMALEDRTYNERYNARTVFFGYFESEQDPAVARALFGAAEAWARARGADLMLGPTNPTTNDEAGLLVDGFDSPPVFMMPYNPPWYADLVEGAGYRKAEDLLAYYIDIGQSPIERLERLAAISRKRYPQVQYRPVRRRTIPTDLRKIKEVYNLAWEDNWGFVPMTDGEIDFMAERLKPLLVEGLVWLAEVEERPVAFLLATPDFNEIIQPLRGRLLSPGLPRFLAGLLGWRSTRLCRVLVLGAIKGWRSKGLEAVMLSEGFKVGYRLGFVGAEASWVLEQNLPVRRVIETMGGRVYKTYRLYQKPL